MNEIYFLRAIEKVHERRKQEGYILKIAPIPWNQSDLHLGYDQALLTNL